MVILVRREKSEMETLHYTDEHKKFRQKVKTFMENEIFPTVDMWEKNRIMPRNLWKRMGEEGFLCTNISSEYGGIDGDFLHSIIMIEEFSRANHTEQGPSGHSDIVVPYIDYFASDELKKKYLPGCVSGDIITALAMTEPDAGSDVAGIKTSAVENGDETVINGTKIFISSGIHCDLVVLAAKDPLVENPYESVSLYLVEAGTPGFDKGRKLEKMGMNSGDTAELFFSNCTIPISNRLGQKGKGFNMLMHNLQQERLVLTINALCAAEYILQNTFEHYKKNAASARSGSKSQIQQFALVEMATEVKLGKTFLEKLIFDVMEGNNVIIEISMAKYWIAEMVRRVADRCLELFDDLAMLKKCPVERSWRDIRVFSIIGGTNEIMKNIIAKYMKL